MRGFDPDGGGQHRGGGARGVRGQSDSGSSGCRTLRSAAGCSSPPTATPASTTPTRTTFSRASGFAYALSDKTVVRGGVGVYAVPNIILGNFQPGYSSSSADRPDARQRPDVPGESGQPVSRRRGGSGGRGDGANTFLGRSLTTTTNGVRLVPLEFASGQNMRYIFSVQRELPGQWVLEAAYAGSRGWDLTTGGGAQAGEIELNGVPAQYLSTSRVRDQAAINFLTAQVPNPFRGLLPGTSFNGATVARQQLLRPFPQFDNIQTRASDGTSRYNSAQFKLEKRFTQRLQPAGGLHVVEVHRARVPAESDRHRIRGAAVGIRRAAPPGAQRHLRDAVRHAAAAGAADASGVAEALAGGWSVQAIGQLQSGRPISFHDRNIYFGGDLNSLKANYSGDTNQPVFDISGFYFNDAAGADQRAGRTRRCSAPISASGWRTTSATSRRACRVCAGMGLNLWDISLVKQLRFTDRVRGQFHVEFLNAFNRAVYNNPNTDPLNAEFGKVTSQANLPRDIQIALKLIF